jgi:hypothetical protein
MCYQFVKSKSVPRDLDEGLASTQGMEVGGPTASPEATYELQMSQSWHSITPQRTTSSSPKLQESCRTAKVRFDDQRDSRFA